MNLVRVGLPGRPEEVSQDTRNLLDKLVAATENVGAGEDGLVHAQLVHSLKQDWVQVF